MSRLSDRALQRLGYAFVAAAAIFGLTSVVLAVADGEIPSGLENLVLIGGFLTTTTLALRAQPRNGAVWALVGAGFFGSASSFGGHIAAARTGFAVAAIEDGAIPGSPADYDLVSAIGINVSLWAWVPSAFLLATLLLILFPNGQVPSRRWRVTAWMAGVCIAGLSIQGLTQVAPWKTETYETILGRGDGTTMGGIAGLLMLPLMLIALASVIRIVIKYRRTEGEEKLQYRWVAWALGLYVVVGIFMFEALRALGDAGGIISGLLLVNIPLSIGVAITKYRLYQIDAVISRTFVYGALAAFIGGVYVAIVVGIGQLIGSGDEPNTALALAATAIVAVAFQPIRRRLDRVANRLVYGRRATPYEVLSEFSQRVAATDDSLLVEAARGLVDGTAAQRVTVTTRVRRTDVDAATWPREAPNGPAPERTSFAISHDGRDLGALILEVPRGQRLPEADRRLAEELASGMGLALQNRSLTAALEAQVAELRHSRRRLVAVQDETRRRLERDLHDGAQQQLVALKVKLGLARALAEKADASRTAELLQGLSSEADQTVEAMREFARGVYPPLLEAEGLGSVVRAHARRLELPVTVQAEHLGRYDRQTESTIYFCVQEALDNVMRHAEASEATVTLQELDGRLEVTVSDDGAGFDLDAVTEGTGIINMTDRVGALDGELGVQSTSEGTTVRVTVPMTPSGDAADDVEDEPAAPAEIGGIA